MIIEEVTGEDISPGSLTQMSVNSAFASPTNWTVSGSAIRLNTGALAVETAGYFIANFSLSSGITVPTDITNAWLRGMQLAGLLQTSSAAVANYTIKMTGFTLYNEFDFSALDFATLDSWVGNDTMTNGKFSPVEFSGATSSTTSGADYGQNGVTPDVSTLGDNYTSQINVSGVTAIGVMCESITAVNSEQSNTFGKIFQLELDTQTEYFPVA